MNQASRTMAVTQALVSIEEYLSTTYKPACEFLDGQLQQRPLPSYAHAQMEYAVCSLINSKYPDFSAVPELTVRLSERVFLVPDVAVQRRSEIQRPYPVKPIYLVVEVLSPADKMSDLARKCESYHEWGVRYCWLIDPESRQAWEYESGRRLQSVAWELQAGEIVIPLVTLFDSDPIAI